MPKIKQPSLRVTSDRRSTLESTAAFVVTYGNVDKPTPPSRISNASLAARHQQLQAFGRLQLWGNRGWEALDTLWHVKWCDTLPDPGADNTLVKAYTKMFSRVLRTRLDSSVLTWAESTSKEGNH